MALLRTLLVVVGLVALAPSAHGQTACDADSNRDGVVDAADVARVLGTWGPCADCASDLDGDGAVGATDLAITLELWGAACDPLPWATVLEFVPDPAVVADEALRNAIAATGLPWRVRDDISQIEMLLVPPGTFDMGCSPSDMTACSPDETPVRPVTISQGFYIGRYEVTQAQWTARMGSNPSSFQGGSETDAARRPVEGVSWYSAVGFLSSSGLRLPTEAEWEYACRAGTRTAFHSLPGRLAGTDAESFADGIGWSALNSDGQTHAVGVRTANALGLFDMSGNVAEWVRDWYAPGYGESGPVTDPTGPSIGVQRVLRSGGWIAGLGALRSSARLAAAPGSASNTFGVRAARSVFGPGADGSADQMPGPPTITAVAPSAGPVGGGTTITITGTNLVGTTAVKVGTVSATGIVVLNATTVTAVTPAGTLGAKTISLTTSLGTATLSPGFTYVAAPTITTVTPASGPAVGGTTITIAGTNLTGASTVTVGGVAATNVTVVSATSVTAVTPDGAPGAKNVTVVTPGGSATRTNGFTHVAAPTITSVSPSAGPLAGGTTITITGTNLTGASAVRVNGVNATGVVVVNPTTVTAVTPAGTAGTRDVTLTTAGGTATAAGAFTYVPLPTITSVGPSAGPLAGGTVIAISGTELLGTTAVKVGGVNATNVQVVNAFGGGGPFVLATTPAGTAGLKSVSVTTPGGTTTRANAFNYVGQPTITSATPTSGPLFGGTAVTITGTNLVGVQSVLVGGAPAFISSSPSATTLVIGTPSRTAGPKDIVVNAAGGSVTRANGFTYIEAPTIASVSPAAGPPSGGTLITITGTNLTGTSAVRVNGVLATGVVVVNPTTVTALTPAGAVGLRPVSVTTAGGETTLPLGFYYHPVPTLTGVSPAAGPLAGGTTITLTGTNFAGTTGVKIGTVPATNLNIINDGLATVVTPAGTAGVRNVSLTSPGGTATRTNAFTYVGTPTVTSVTPSTGLVSGGTTITIAGTNLTGTSFVTVGGVAATNVTVVSASSVTAVTPAGAPGPKNVTVFAGGGSATRTNGFTHLPPPATIATILPASGLTTGGVTITITGTNLATTSAVTIGGVAATAVTPISDAAVTAVVPAGTVGAKNVVLTTLAGSVTRTGGFTYVASGTTPSWATVLEAAPNPAFVTSAALRAAISATGYPWRVRDNATNIEMVLVPPGTFAMGCSPSESSGCLVSETPVRTVAVTTPFYMGRTEVTQAQWQARTGSNPSFYVTPSAEVPFAQVASRPVESVTLAAMQSFLLSSGMRLPTEAEWEYAYRAGTQTAYHGSPTFPNGSDIDLAVEAIGWYESNSAAQTRPVAQKAPNGFGIFDMAGNVWERVSDRYSDTYYAWGPSANPRGPATGESRTVRGGSHLSFAGNLRSSLRVPPEGDDERTVGFRVVRDVATTISSVSPDVSLTTGGRTITITGTGLGGTTGVTIGGVAATSVTVIDGSTVRAVTPAGAAGAKTIAVTTSAGNASLPNAITYVAARTVPSWATAVPGETLPDPLVVTNPALRSAIIATGAAWRVRDTVTQVEMVLIPPGSFNMGCSPSDLAPCTSPENPVHAVSLTNAFYMSRTEITQAQWQARMGNNPSFFNSPSAEVPAGEVPNRPVETVSWNEIQPFLAATGFRLPTEAEWEYAYRAGTTTAYHSMPDYPNGTNLESNVSVIGWGAPTGSLVGGTLGQSRPVGGKAANAFGLYDMAGNVWELVYDWFEETYYASSPSTNPTGPSTGSNRGVRGGGFNFPSEFLRASFRTPIPPSLPNSQIGFRVARSLASTAPTVTAVSPSVGIASGGVAITITGTNLTGTTSVLVGGVAATGVTVVNATTVTALTSASTGGIKDVVVTTPGGVARRTGGYTAIEIPAWASVLELVPNPAVVTNATTRNAILATGYAWRVVDNTTQIEMMLVPPGSFNMGCTASTSWGCAADESPFHPVTLTKAFYMGRYEVTQAKWSAVLGSNPSQFTSPSAQVSESQVQNRPVEQVSWNAVQQFLALTGMRLPTEAEWEYAYRAGTATAFHSMPSFPNGTNADAQLGTIAWIDANSTNQTRPGGGKAANGLGLHDMSGNVLEWVNDIYSATYYGSSPTNDPAGPATGGARVLRGGAWNLHAFFARASYRTSLAQNATANNAGFRVARSPSPSLPVIDSIFPNNGPTTGGTSITIAGSNLQGTTSVLIGGVPAVITEVVGTAFVQVTVPPGSAGPKDVVVTAAGGVVRLSGGFVYNNPS